MGKAHKPSLKDPSKFVVDTCTKSTSPDKHVLYQQAVQYPPGDISWMLKFYKQYIGSKAPCHLREDFCGTALISATWCRQDVCRTATGIDLDGDVLRWALQHNMDGCSGRLCLTEANVLQPPSSGKAVQQESSVLQQQERNAAPAIYNNLNRSSQLTNITHNTQDHEAHMQTGDAQVTVQDAAIHSCCFDNMSLEAEEPLAESREDLVTKPADIICAFNFSVCLLHKRSEVLTYFKQARRSLCSDPGGVFVLDLMGGHSVECVGSFKRSNFITGARYTFEQEKYNPLSKMIRCHMSLQDPNTKKVLRRAFTYNWRLWSVSDIVELLKEAGFQRIAVWVKPLQGSSYKAIAKAKQGGRSNTESSDDSNGHTSSDDEAAQDCDSGVHEKAPYKEYNPATASTAYLDQLATGWTAFVVAVVLPSYSNQ